MLENFTIFDFELTEDEMKSIEGLDQEKSLFFDHQDPETAEFFMTLIK